MDLGGGGQASGGDTATLEVRGWALQEVDATEDALPAMGTPTQSFGQNFKRPLIVLATRHGGVLPLTERIATTREELGAGAVGEKAVVADPNKTLGEDVEEEAPTELAKGERLGPGPAGAVVFVAEGDGLVIQVDQPVVGDGDAVSIASKVPQNLLGAVEGRLGVHHPFGAPCFLEEAMEHGRTPIGDEAAVELQPPIPEGLGKAC